MIEHNPSRVSIAIAILLLCFVLPQSFVHGAGWTSQTSGTNLSFRWIYFIDTDRGWAVGGSGTILNTTNGGNNWIAQTSGTSNLLYGIYFIDPDLGWATGTMGTILHTTNGGQTWSAQVSNTNETLNGARFVDHNIGWAIGLHGTILHTTNGGATWSAQASRTSRELVSAAFVNSNTGWVAGDSGVVVHTTNGGATWVHQHSGTTEWIEGVSFTDAQTGWGVGTIGTILHTGNGGSTWTAQTSSVDASLLSVCFTDANNGWVAGADFDAGIGYILHTTNGGTTWLTQPHDADASLGSVHFVDSRNGWVAGGQGSILHTTDGGTGVEPPDEPIPLTPGNGSTISANPVLSWSPSPTADWYTVQISTSPYFTTYDLNETGVTENFSQVDDLQTGSLYYWRVSVTDEMGTSGWSDVWSFTPVEIPCGIITFFNAKCNSAGIAQAIVRIPNSSEYAGVSLQIQIDEAYYPVVLMTNGTHTIGRLQVQQTDFGGHIVNLINPPGCFDPITINCQIPPGADWEIMWDESAAIAEPESNPGQSLLIGAFPNPFNPETSIRFEIAPARPNDGQAIDGRTGGDFRFVTLAVMDLLGRNVSTLVNERLAPGTYTVRWNATGLPSGIYFARLQAGNLVDVSKMMYIR